MNILRFLREQAKDYDCSVCGTNHARSKIQLLGRIEAAYIVRVTCAKCKTSIKLLVVVDEQPAGAPDAPVEKPAARRVKKRPAVTIDEVIDAHEFLRQYAGGLDALLPATDRARSGGGRGER